MKPLRAWAANYGPYESVTWDIPEGVTAIIGQNEGGEGISSNGAGKTRLLELIPLALWGPASSWSDYVSAGSDATCEVGLEFEHGGDVFRVRRTFSPKGRGKTTLDFEVLAEREPRVEAATPTGADPIPIAPTGKQSSRSASTWEPLTRESQAATQAAIAALLGISEATFHHTVFAAQGARHFADADLTPKERMEVLADGLALNAWEPYKDAAATERRAIEAEHDALTAQLASWADALANREEIEYTATFAEDGVNEWDNQVAIARQRHIDLDDILRKAKESRAGYDAAYREVAACQSAITAIEREQATKRQQAANRRNELARERDRHTARADAHEHEAHIFKAKADAVAEAAERIAAEGAGTCDRCEQAIRGASLAATINSMKAEAATLHDEAERLAAEATKARHTAEQYQAEHDTITDHDDDPDAAEKKAAADLALRDATSRMSAMKATAADDAEMVALERDVAQATAEVARCERELAQAHSAHGEAKERLRALNEIAAQHAAGMGRVVGLAFDLDVLRELEKAYGRSGIPVLLLESLYVPRIEVEANRVLEAWGVPFSVELRTQRELKSADRLRDTLDVVVHSPGGVRSFRTYSGGERDRVSTALRISLARVISSLRGHSLGVFALDELAHLDSAGTERLAELLRELSREIACVLFVSHASDLNDAFDQRVLVVRENGRSRLEEAA